MRKKKSLGQHFLTSPRIAARIADAGNLSERDAVLEIGPGGGILTRELLKRAGHVIAIEKDKRLLEPLREQFADAIERGELELVEGDVLAFNPSVHDLQRSSYAVVANIPYYITGAILEHLLTADIQPSRMVLLVQKEVAERIVAHDKKESVLSISIKAYGTPRYAGTVSKNHFRPKPKVDSAILAVENISRSFLDDVSEETFFTLVKAGFAHKRKYLIRNIERLFESREEAAACFEHCGIDTHARAENLTLQNWKCLSQKR